MDGHRLLFMYRQLKMCMCQLIVSIKVKITRIFLTFRPEFIQIFFPVFYVLRYFINLCQGIHGGLPGCQEGATVCRRSAAGKTQVLGRVYTQKMSYTGG